MNDYHRPNYTPAYHHPNAEPAALPEPFDEARATRNCTDPLLSAASCLLRLEAPTRNLDIMGAREALESRAEHIRRNDLSGIETTLAAQVQMLHMLFAQAIERYAAGTGGYSDGYKNYGNIALKAQSYCRMTVAALTKLKTTPLPPPPVRKIEEPAIQMSENDTKSEENTRADSNDAVAASAEPLIIDEPAIQRSDYAMDSGSAPTAGAEDSAVATVENSGP